MSIWHSCTCSDALYMVRYVVLAAVKLRVTPHYITSAIVGESTHDSQTQ